MKISLYLRRKGHVKRPIILFVVLLLVAPISQLKTGDINRDGKVTATDLVQLRQMVEGDRPQSGNADLNNDGVVDEVDLQILRDKLASSNEKQLVGQKEMTSQNVETK